MKKPLLFLGMLLTACFAFAQPAAKNVNLVGQLSYTESLSDIWGYVDTSGTEWAIVGTFNGTSIVDLSNPASPTERFYIPGAGSIWRDIKTWDHYAYVTNETANGLLIIDLDSLPSTIHYKDTMIDGMNSAHNLYIDSSGYCYIVGADIDGGGVTILDLNTDPWNPTKVGAYTTRYVHDIYVRNDTAYLSEVYDGFLTVLDVSNKSSLVTLGSVTYGDAFTHNAWLSDNSQTCFTTDELAFAYLISWDVSDPGNIKELDRIRSSLSGGSATPHNTHVYNDFLVTSYYADGLNIVDANRPGNLVEVGYYDTSNLVGGGTNGQWGTYPFLPSGIVISSDMNEGLFVFDVNYKRASYLEGTITEAGSGLPINDALVEVVLQDIEEPTDLNGEYAVGFADSGSFEATVSKYGYLPVDSILPFSPGNVTTWNVSLQPAPQLSLQIRVIDSLSGDPIEDADVAALIYTTTLTYSTDASGVATDPAFFSGDYEIIAGKWGYKTKGVTVSIDTSTTMITIELAPGYYDDFIFDNSWTSSGTASQGHWEWGEPVGTEFFGYTINPDNDVADDFGHNCLVTGNGGGLVGDDDVSNGYTEVTSPTMDLSTYGNPWIIFDSWFITVSGSGSPGFNDSLVIEVDNGIDRKIVWEEHAELLPVWLRDTIRITDFITPTADTKIIIRASDNATGQWVEAGIDKLWIYDSPTVSNEEQITQSSFKFFPNPTTQKLFIELPENETGNAQLNILDLNGKIVHNVQLHSNATTVMLPEKLPNGLYQLQIRTTSKVYSGKFLKLD